MCKYLYIVSGIFLDQKVVKIGVSKSVYRRLADIKIYSPATIHIEKSIMINPLPVVDYFSVEDDEEEFDSKVIEKTYEEYATGLESLLWGFLPDHLTGEWFLGTDLFLSELTKAFKYIQKGFESCYGHDETKKLLSLLKKNKNGGWYAEVISEPISYDLRLVNIPIFKKSRRSPKSEELFEKGEKISIDDISTIFNS